MHPTFPLISPLSHTWPPFFLLFLLSSSHLSNNLGLECAIDSAFFSLFPPPPSSCCRKTASFRKTPSQYDDPTSQQQQQSSSKLSPPPECAQHSPRLVVFFFIFFLLFSWIPSAPTARLFSNPSSSSFSRSFHPFLEHLLNLFHFCCC